jgi:hypothetical protein
MKKPQRLKVREPIQIYIDADERRLLDQLADATGLSRAEILRQGLRSFAAERAGTHGPMESFMKSLRKKPFPADMAERHDDYLAAAYRDKHPRG